MADAAKGGAAAAPAGPTPDVFISYARADRETAQALAETLELRGLAVWWDRELTGGGDFAQEIERNLWAARLALVLWSPTSVRSDFVRDESSRARDLKKLLPVRIAACELPLGFGTLHTLDLLDWDGDPDDAACVALVAQVRERLLAAGPTAQPPGPPAGRSGLERAEEDSFARRRSRRRLLGSLAVAGTAALGGAGWWGWRESRRRTSQALLAQALADHFADPPLLEKAEAEYNQALQYQPTLAPAHYYLAHLYAQMTLRGDPPPEGEVLAALRRDAQRHFTQALEGAKGLNGAQQVIARTQLALLDTRNEPAPLQRPVEVATAGGPAPSPAPGPDAGTGAGAPPPGPGEATGAPPGGLPAKPVKPPPPAASASAPATTPAAAQPPRVAPTAAAQLAAQRRGDSLFTTDRDSRLATTTALTLDPGLAADTLPSAITRATEALRQAPSQDTTRQGLGTTLALLERASPALLRANQAALKGLISVAQTQPDASLQPSLARLEQALERSERRQPVVYLQIALEAQRPLARQVARQLQAAGYLVPGIENTGEARAPSQTALRIQGGSDPALARWCQRLLANTLQGPVNLVTLRNAKAETDTYEIWLDAALCAPAGRIVAACT